MAKSKGYESFVGKLGIGFDPVLDLIKSVDSSTSIDYLSAIPPYNIKKTSDTEYTLELDLTGVDKEDVKATLDADCLTVEATVKIGFDADSASDDVYFHQGIFAGGHVSAKFLVARNLKFKNAKLDDGILSVNFSDTNRARVLTTLAIGPFPKADVSYTVEYNSAGAPIMVPAGETVDSENAVPLELPKVLDQQKAASSPPPAVSVDQTLPEPVVETAPDTTSVVVHDDSEILPTVTVETPPVVPPIVEATISDVAPTVDTTSTDSQATITLSDAIHEVPDNAVLTTVKTPDGVPDVVVAMTPETKEAADAAGLDVPAAVSQALDHPDVTVAPAEEVPVVTETTPVAVADNNVDPPKIEVQVPDTITPVVEVSTAETSSSETPAVTITPSDGTNLPADNVLVPIVTQAGEHDVIASIPQDVHDDMVAAGVDPSTALSQAVQSAAPDVTSTPDAPITVLTNDQNSAVATTNVEMPPELPQVVTAEVTDVKPVVDPVSDVPQATVTLTDATHEVVSDNVVTTVAKTPDGSADVVVAVDADHQAEMKEKGIDVLQSAKDAIELAPADVELPTPPPVDDAPVTAAPADVIVQPTGDPDASPVTVSVPEVLPSVVEATVSDDNKVVLSDTSENVPADATLTPVVTAADQHDIVVATTPETDAKLADLGVDVGKDVSTAVVAAGTPVVTSADAPAPDSTVADPAPVATDAAAVVDPAPVATDPVVEPVTLDTTTSSPESPSSTVVETPVSSEQPVVEETPAPVVESAPVVDAPVEAPVADATVAPDDAPVVETEAAPVSEQSPEALIADTPSDFQ